MIKGDLFSIDGNTLRMKTPLYFLIVKAHIDNCIDKLDELMDMAKSGLIDVLTAQGTLDIALNGSLEALKAFLSPKILKQAGFSEKDVKRISCSLKKVSRALKSAGSLASSPALRPEHKFTIATELDNAKKSLLAIKSKISYIAYI